MFVRKSFKSLVDSFCLNLTSDELEYAHVKLGFLLPHFLSTLKGEFLQRSSSFDVVHKDEVVHKKKKKKKNNKNKRNKIKKNLQNISEVQLKSLNKQRKDVQRDIELKKKSVSKTKDSPSRRRRKFSRAEKFGNPLDVAMTDVMYYRDSNSGFWITHSNKSVKFIYWSDIKFFLPFARESSISALSSYSGKDCKKKYGSYTMDELYKDRKDCYHKDFVKKYYETNNNNVK